MERKNLINEFIGEKCSVYISGYGYDGNFEATFDEIDESGQLIGDCRITVDWTRFDISKIADDTYDITDGTTLIELTVITK